MKNSKKALCIALVVILICSIAAAALQTDFFKVSVRDINIATDNNEYIHALAFIPKNASASNKVPVVITSHGWLNTGEVQDAASIELARRGIMVIAMDATGHGLSSNPDGSIMESVYSIGMGMIPLVEYVTSGTLDFVDTDRVGVMGHSMGGMNSIATTQHYGSLYYAALEEAKAADSDGGAEITAEEQAYADSLNKVKASLPTGASPGGVDWTKIACNMGVLYGGLEEGGYSSSTGTAKLTGATPEALPLAQSVDPSVTSVEEGKFYGDAATGTLRVFYQPNTTHPLIHFDPASTADVIEFFTHCFGIQTTLGPKNQTFFIKELFNGVAMAALLYLMVPMLDLLLKVPCFASLRGVEGPKIPAPDTKEKKRKFWFGWALGAVISFVTAVITIKIYSFIFPAGFAKNTYLFPATTMNVVMLWTLFNTIWSFFWFFFNYKKDKAAGIRTDEMIGLKITGKEFWNTLGLAITVIGFTYAIVWFCKWAFQTDFRLWTPAIKTFNVEKLYTYIQYIPVFFAFYLANSLMVNGANRFEGVNEKKNLLILGIGNMLGCVTMWAVQYGKLILTGSVVWGPEWIGVLVINFCFWQLFLAPYFLRAFYKLTGKNWVGAMIVSSMYVLSGVMHTAIHLPLF